MAAPEWQFNEMRQVGTDYGDPVKVQEWEAVRARLIDPEQEAARIAERLALGPESTVIDMGAGTGVLALRLAARCKHVYAVDVSEAMLDVARAHAAEAGAENISFHHAGFLTYEHADEPADAAVSIAALHHLPDFWKAAALRRLASMLKPSGRFHLFDTVYSFDPTDRAHVLDGFIAHLRGTGSHELADDAVLATREEYSTCEWIMRGLLQRAGFAVESTDTPAPTIAIYLCRRTP